MLSVVLLGLVLVSDFVLVLVLNLWLVGRWKNVRGFVLLTLAHCYAELVYTAHVLERPGRYGPQARRVSWVSTCLQIFRAYLLLLLLY